MKMYRYKNRIFLTIQDAIFYIKHGCRQYCKNPARYDALAYGYIGDIDPFEELSKNGFVCGIKL